MSLELNIERQIREAIDRGDFENLKGKGQPLDLDAYFSTPEDLRMAYSLLKSNDYIPEEVDRLREIDDLRQKIKVCDDDNLRRSLTKTLQEKHLSLTLLLENRKRKR